MEYSAPQVAGRDEPFRSAIREHLKGHTQGLEDLAIEMLARGLSVRDIEDAFKDETGRLLLSKTAVSQLGERLWEDYRAFTQRDLSEYEITYLFVDGIAERLRPGAKREPVLAAWGFTIEGRRVLLHMMAGSKEDAETVTAFFEDMKRRGLNDPLLVHRVRTSANHCRGKRTRDQEYEAQIGLKTQLSKDAAPVKISSNLQT
jgi:putative transposase